MTDGRRPSVPLTRLSDDQWERARPLRAAYDPPKREGRKRCDQRGVLEAVLHWRRTGRLWNALPQEYPNDSTVHRTHQRWQRLGVLDRLLTVLDPADGDRPEAVTSSSGR